MSNIDRRQEILRLLTITKTPLSGSKLAAQMGVSRQIIVQDIALLRMQYPILATAQGYLLYQHMQDQCRRSYLVRHTAEQISDELLTIVCAGGHVLDVIVEHDVYGQIRADLNLSSPDDVRSFCARLAASASGPLFPISDGIHIHTVEAPTEEILDHIEQLLAQKSYLQQ